MEKSKKFMYIGIIILLISVVGSVGTYAWFTWTSTNNTKVTLTIGKLADVIFDSGPDINVTDLGPVFNYTDGVSTTFSITNSDTSSQLLYRLKLNIDTISNELISKDFKYTLLKNDEVVYTGDFSSAMSGSTMILNTGSVDKATSKGKATANYTLYFWIDGNEENDPNMMSKLLKGTIEVGVESNILTRDSTTPSSGTSTFLNSTLTRESIESVNISGTNTEPSGSLGSFDVSKNQDNSITMWYTDIDNDNLYEVTIGSADNNTIYANTDSSYLFGYLTNVTNLDINNLDTSAVTDMTRMLEYLTSLQSLDLSNFNTSNVTNMNSMFIRSGNISSLNLSSFDTSNVKNMISMFHGCSSLISLDLSNFNTSKVTIMANMFYDCTSLTSLDLSNFNTSKVINMADMFSTCTSLVNLNVSNFNTSNVTTMEFMFVDCSSLTSLNLSSFNTQNVTNMNSMFSGCSSLTSLNLSSFNTQNVTNMEHMFQGIGGSQSNKINLNLSSFSTPKVTKTNQMFYCNKIGSIDLSNADFSSVIDSTGMFKDMSSNSIIKLKDTVSNRTLMSNFPSYTPTYVG